MRYSFPMPCRSAKSGARSPLHALTVLVSLAAFAIQTYASTAPAVAQDAKAPEMGRRHIKAQHGDWQSSASRLQPAPRTKSARSFRA